MGKENRITVIKGKNVKWTEQWRTKDKNEFLYKMEVSIKRMIGRKKEIN